MIKMSDAPFQIYGLEAKDFFKWCKIEKKPNYALASKKEFFSLLNQKKVYKKDNKLIIGDKEYEN